MLCSSVLISLTVCFTLCPIILYFFLVKLKDTLNKILSIMQKHVCKFSFLVFFAVASAQMVLFYKMLLKLMSTFSSGFSQRFHFWLTGQYCNRYWSASHSQTFWTQVSFCQSKEKKSQKCEIFLFLYKHPLL